MTTSELLLAELVRAVHTLGLVEARDLERAAGLLGLGGAAVSVAVEVRVPASRSASLEQRAVERPPASPPPVQGAPGPVRSTLPVPTEAEPAELEELPREGFPGRAPRRVAPLSELLPPADARAQSDVSLFTPRWQRTILSALASSDTLDGPVDVEQVVESMARGRAISQLPREKLATTRKGLQVLLDISDDMRPFSPDVVALDRALRQIAGRDGVETLKFEHSPKAGVGSGPRRSWRVYRGPRAGTPVLVVSDFGISSRDGSGAERQRDWAAVARALRAQGSPLLALTPFPETRWPAWLSRCFAAVAWDRQTRTGAARRIAREASDAGINRRSVVGPSAVRAHSERMSDEAGTASPSAAASAADDAADSTARVDRLRRLHPGAYRLGLLLSPAAQVELPLLRRARLRLPELDAAAEADLWASDVIASRTPQGFLFDPAVAEALRERLAREPELMRASWDLIAAEHGRAPWHLRAEERINWLASSGAPEHGAEAQQLLLATAAHMVESSDRAGAARWLMRMLARLPSGLAASAEANTLRIGVGAQLDGYLGGIGEHLTPDAIENWLPWLLPGSMGRVQVEVTLLDGALELVVAVPGLVSTPGSKVLSVPATTPVVIELRWHDGRELQQERVSLEPGKKRHIPVGAQSLELRALDGAHYRLRVRGADGLAQSGFDFGAVRAKHRPFFGRSGELRELEAWWTRAAPPESNVLAITGSPGAGKTALASRFVDKLLQQQREPALVYFAGADGAGDEHLTAALRAQLAVGGHDPTRGLEELLWQASPLSLVIDQPAADSMVFALLQRTARAAVVTTTSEVARRFGLRELNLDERTESNRQLCELYLEAHAGKLGRVRSCAGERPMVMLSGAWAENPALREETLETLHAEGWGAELASSFSDSDAADEALSNADLCIWLGPPGSEVREVRRARSMGRPALVLHFEPLEAGSDHSGDLDGVPLLALASNAEERRARLMTEVRRGLRDALQTPSALLMQRCAGNIGRLIEMLDWIGNQPRPRVSLGRMPAVLYRTSTPLPLLGDPALERPMLAILAAAKEPLENRVLSGFFEASGREARALAARGLVERQINEARDPLERWNSELVSLSHEKVRDAVIHDTGPEGMRDAHRILGHTLNPLGGSSWGERARGYWLRHGVSHLLDAGLVQEAVEVATDGRWLRDVCATHGVASLEAQLERLSEHLELDDSGPAEAQ